ncbi:hypothetical protein KEJ19_00610 [Candidatus Bathyarchaeota archaeon]|nr:hypothetical protein [Candidatus Bathyarchaeota archaeon]
MVWHKVKPYSELGLRLIHDRSLLKPPERLSKEVKRRLKDFSYLRPFLYFPCRCENPFSHLFAWLEAWKGYYNVRYHMALGKAPCGSFAS